VFKHKFVDCPICKEPLPLRGNKMPHYGKHVLTEEGAFGYRCPCGEARFWADKVFVEVGMAQHFADRHGISTNVSQGL